MYNDQLTPEQIAMFYTDRAVRGAEFLDKEMPGWAARIDVTKLDMGDGQCCVLGQLFDDDSCEGSENYFLGVEELRLGEDGRPTEAALGFYLRNAYGDFSSWNKLTYAWVTEIVLRTVENNQESK